MNSNTANEIPTDFKSTLPPRKRAKTQEEKEQRRIERILRNRKAAHQSREKKRLHLMYLEKKCVLLQRIVARVDLEEVVLNSADPELRRDVEEYKVFARDEGESRSRGPGGGKARCDGGECTLSYSTGSVVTTPDGKSPSMSCTTPVTPCNTIADIDGAELEQQDLHFESVDGFAKAEVDSYMSSTTLFEDPGPRSLSFVKGSESWNLLLTHPHSYPAEDNINESLEMTDSSLELDHWRNPAEIVHWEGAE